MRISSLLKLWMTRRLWTSKFKPYWNGLDKDDKDVFAYGSDGSQYMVCVLQLLSSSGTVARRA